MVPAERLLCSPRPGAEMEERKLKEAARPTLERIRVESERVSPKLRPFLETIWEHLLEPGFNVTGLWRERGVRHKSSAVYFHELGTTPGKYLSDARMDIAAHLLLATHYQLWRVADLLGLSVRTLARRFKDRHGLTPEEYRLHGSGIPGETADGRVEKIVQGVHGRLDEPDGAALAGTVAGVLDRLSVYYPRPSSAPAFPLILSGRDVEAYQVRDRIWPGLRVLPFEEQRYRVLACRGFSTPAFYELLHRQSREEGRKDRQRGVELAQLALDSLEANAETLGAYYSVLRPQACAWLGNAHRLTLDFLAADGAIDEAVRGLEKIRDPFATGIVYLCQGTLRTFQRRYDEAEKVFRTALLAFEDADNRQWAITAAIYQASSLTYQGRLESALEALLGVSDLPEYAELIAYDLFCDIAAVLERLGRFREAEKYLDHVRSTPAFDDSKWRHHWVAANVDQGLGRMDSAESKYLLTSRLLEELDEPLYCALLQLDLALLYIGQQRVAEVAEICKKIVPVFESLRLYEETLVSVQLFGSAISQSAVTRDKLHDLRLALRRDPLVQRS